MSNIDISRKYDLEELQEIYRKETNSHYRLEIEKIMSDIIHQSGASHELRNKLIAAVRANDNRAKRYFTDKLLLMKQEKEHGRQF